MFNFLQEGSLRFIKKQWFTQFILLSKLNLRTTGDLSYILQSSPVKEESVAEITTAVFFPPCTQAGAVHV